METTQVHFKSHRIFKSSIWMGLWVSYYLKVLDYISRYMFNVLNATDLTAE